MLFKMDLRVQMDAKSGQLKIESMSSGVAPKGELCTKRMYKKVHLMLH